MGAIRGVRLQSLPHLAVAHAATTSPPNPSIAGVMAWSTVESRVVSWNGSRWMVLPVPPWWDAPSGNVTLTIANDNTMYDTASTSRAFTVSAGIPMYFQGVSVRGPCTWVAASGVTIDDQRKTGDTRNFCHLVPVAFNTYRLDGVTT